MCERCETIDKTIARYRWLTSQLPDYQINQIAEGLIVKLEAEKVSLHRQGKLSPS